VFCSVLSTAIISLYSINLGSLLFIAERDCADSAVGTESLNTIQINVRFL
jgi:hypothetical protein